MNSKKAFLAGILAISTCAPFARAQQAQPSALFEKYKKDHTTLPDFSYAGYQGGEKELPANLKYKIFDVTTFGARPDDNISDRDAIQAAIHAAEKNGSGIIFFPKGRFLVNEDSTNRAGIKSTGSHIVFKGSGSGKGGTELFMKYPLLPEDPDKMWTSPSMLAITTTRHKRPSPIAQVTAVAKQGDMQLQLNTTAGIKKGDWIKVSMLNNDPALVKEAVGGHDPDASWKYIIDKGVDVFLFYRVNAIKGKNVYIHAPVPYTIDPQYKWEVTPFANAEETGVEDIAFTGNFKEKFVHHSSWIHDSGYSLFEFSDCTNSWMKNCRFTDCSVGALVKQSANITIANCVVTGNGGHEAITSNGSMNVLFARLQDDASQWHSFGSSHGAMNTVIWHCTYPPNTCFEAHASQPRNTLLDNVTGGLMQNRAGGALANMPNHLTGLIFWNYTQTNAPVKNFEFWSSTSQWWKIYPPIIAGFKSGGTTFKTPQLQYAEGIGTFVTPASLYEAQVQLRLGKTPKY